EYGNVREGGGTHRYGWLGAKQRSAETPTGLFLMGARLYNPTTGRFLSVDPIPGGNANDYDYCKADPVNCVDLDGRWGWLRKVAKAATYMPGFIGTAANIGWAAYYASRGQWGRAAGHAVGAASFGITRYTSLVGRYAQRSRSSGLTSRWLGRHKIGRLNRNDWVRFGWSWRGSAKKGRNMVGLRLGSRRHPVPFYRAASITMW
ncbi:MAG TPA: RHS repeat-associated core domain-containing protein, partial [Mycobacteriales bacterium]|nr:RHS repeat-associated core domain-containing protein [Mycobacteriales bacterium]